MHSHQAPVSCFYSSQALVFLAVATARHIVALSRIRAAWNPVETEREKKNNLLLLSASSFSANMVGIDSQ